MSYLQAPYYPWKYYDFEDCIQNADIIQEFNNRTDINLELIKHFNRPKNAITTLHQFLSKINKISFSLDANQPKRELVQLLDIFDTYDCVLVITLRVKLKKFNKISHLFGLYPKLQKIELDIHPFHEENWNLFCSVVSKHYISKVMFNIVGVSCDTSDVEKYKIFLKQFEQASQSNWSLIKVDGRFCPHFANIIWGIDSRLRNKHKKYGFLCGDIVIEE